MSVPPVRWTVMVPVGAVSSEREMAVGLRENTPPGLSLAAIVTTAVSYTGEQITYTPFIFNRGLLNVRDNILYLIGKLGLRR